MANKIQSVLVLGLGKVGHLVGVLLHETGFRVTGATRNEDTTFPFDTINLDYSDTPQLTRAIGPSAQRPD